MDWRGVKHGRHRCKFGNSYPNSHQQTHSESQFMSFCSPLSPAGLEPQPICTPLLRVPFLFVSRRASLEFL